jgi:Uncharacterised protein family (UPF0259)
MKSLSLFNSFVKESFSETKTGFPYFLTSFIAYLILCLSSIVPWEVFGIASDNGWVLLFGVVTGLSSLVVTTNVILIENARLHNTQKERLLYNAPTYLVYMLYSTLAVLAGIILLVIPGFLALIFLSLAPIAAVLSKDKETGYLKQSVNLTKKNATLVSFFVFSSLAVEVVSLLFDFIDSWQIRLVVGIIYSFVEAYSLLILTVISVRIYYHLEGLAKK